ncbi:MAG: hypothetical protein LBG73_03840, partial [Spirochaetaceae bacterium]|nr:hypothetical protein [Spirochaetaceae bacterium]
MKKAGYDFVYLHKERTARLLAFAAFFACFGTLAAESRFMMIPPGDPALEDLRYVSREAGSAMLSFTPPLSRDEALAVLAAADPETLSPSARDAYNRVKERLTPKMRFSEPFFALSFHAIAEIGGGVRSNPDIPWLGGGGNNLYAMRSPVLTLPFGFYFADLIELNLTPSLQQDPYYNERDAYGFTNIPFQAERIDAYFPFRAFLAAGGPWWHFQIGRDRLSMGTGHSGNLTLSDTPDYYDFARLSFFSKHLKYTALVSQMPLFYSEELCDPALWDSRIPDAVLQRHIYVHRLDVNLFGKVSVGFVEGLNAGSSALEIRYLNPMMILHNLFSYFDYQYWKDNSDSGLNSSFFSVEVNVTPVKHISVYGQLVVNELTTIFEGDYESEDKQPNALGYLLGIEYSRSFGIWGALFYGEAVYTDPYLYMDNSPLGAMIWMRRMNRFSMTERLMWMGHPQGRDALLFLIGSRVGKGEDISFSAELAFSLHGEHGLKWDWGSPDGGWAAGAADEVTPTGQFEKKISLSVAAQWKP